MSQVFPWWIVPICCALFFLFYGKMKLRSVIGIAFLSGLLVYGGYSVLLDMSRLGCASQLLADLLGGIPTVLSYIITGVLGGLVSTLGGLVGYQLSDIIKGF